MARFVNDRYRNFFFIQEKVYFRNTFVINAEQFLAGRAAAVVGNGAAVDIKYIFIRSAPAIAVNIIIYNDGREAVRRAVADIDALFPRESFSCSRGTFVRIP